MEAAKLSWARDWLKDTKPNYIHGQFVKSSRVYKNINPANQTCVAQLWEAEAKQIDEAVTGAHEAFQNSPWATSTRKHRRQALEAIGNLIRKHHAELATLESLSNGKLYRESYEDDIPESADIFDYYGGWLDKFYTEVAPVERGFLNYTQREPLGVCGLIVPWNFPLLLACWKIAPALAVGNTVIVKPAPNTALTMLRLAELIDEAKILPPGVFNVLIGGAEVGQGICKHPLVKKISFTGSTDIGREVVKASVEANLKSINLELGGKSPNILFEDTPDLSAALRQSFVAFACHKAEKCSEPTRFLVQESIYKQACEELASLAEDVKCGDPFSETAGQGPQCTQAQFQKIMNYIQIGKDEGAKLIAGGSQERSGDCAEGFYIRPTIFADATSSMRISREEIFGPVLTLIPFSTEAQAIQIANDTRYGLAAGLWTKDVSRAHRVAQKLESGMVFVNKYGCYDFSSPFGGVKDSGWGMEMGAHSLKEFTKLKSIWIKI